MDQKIWEFFCITISCTTPILQSTTELQQSVAQHQFSNLLPLTTISCTTPIPNLVPNHNKQRKDLLFYFLFGFYDIFYVPFFSFGYKSSISNFLDFIELLEIFLKRGEDTNNTFCHGACRFCRCTQGRKDKCGHPLHCSPL